ncbi:MAG: hypothetical protein Q4D81_04620 [Eubacteriales bacterium]|nr:hypothetical protein [Eubacteriales bacterium]
MKQANAQAYRIEKLPWEQAVLPEMLRQYEFAILNLISSFTLDRASVFADAEIPWRECLEAWFFSPDAALHFYEGEDGPEAVRITEGEASEEEAVLEQRYRISNYKDCNDKSFSRLGRVLVVKEYLCADKDGQMQVILTRPADIEP